MGVSLNNPHFYCADYSSAYIYPDIHPTRQLYSVLCTLYSKTFPPKKQKMHVFQKIRH